MRVPPNLHGVALARLGPPRIFALKFHHPRTLVEGRPHERRQVPAPQSAGSRPSPGSPSLALAAPAALVAIVAAVYALASQPTWQASQALILRNEAAAGESGLGKFNRADEMKTVQETILEPGQEPRRLACRAGGNRFARRRRRYPATPRRGHARAAQGGRVRRHRSLLFRRPRRRPPAGRRPEPRDLPRNCRPSSSNSATSRPRA